MSYIEQRRYIQVLIDSKDVTSLTRIGMKPLMFDSDDRHYLLWAERHPDGYVVNLRRQRDASYVVLHRATCRSVHRYAGIDANPGGFTERGYRKLCGISL